MRSHKAIWSFATLAVLAAIALAGLPQTARQAADVRDRIEAGGLDPATIDALIEALDADPRTRRATTRRLVEDVAAAGDADEGRAEVHYARAILAYYGTKNFERAEAEFRMAVADAPDWAWAHNGLGIVLFTLGREAEAQEAWERAIELAPEWTRPYNDRAIQYRRVGRLDEAKEQLLIALDMDPNDAITHYNFGVYNDVIGEHEAARAQYEVALGLDPDMPSAHYNLACGYAREGRVEKAAGYLETAIRINPRFAEYVTTDPDFDGVRDAGVYRRVLEEAAI